MKKSTKLISLILAVVMVFSASCISVAASAIPAAAQGNIEELIKNDNLAKLVTWLIKNLNDAKGDITGTVLKFVYMALQNNNSDNEMMKSFVAEIKKIPDLTKATDEQLAKVLLEWLDTSVLPDLGDNIPAAVTNLTKFIGLTVDLHSVDSTLATVVSATGLANSALFNFGILNNLNSNALKNVKRSGGELNVIKALFQWLADNTGVLEEAVKGNLDLGIVGDYVDVSEYADLIKEIGTLAKSYIYLLIDGHAKGGNFKKGEMAGDWGKSPYASYTADQMLAAALIRLINDNDEVVSKDDANTALGASFYALLAKYGPVLYSRFAVDFLNGTLKKQIAKLKDYPEAAKAFNMDYTFTKDSFNAAFTDANATGFLGQFNNILCIILETVLSEDAFKTVAPEKGTNEEKLNSNLTKACRYVLPILATYSDNLGFDFKGFTADAVKDMALPEMAVAVLKVFFPTWFKDAYDAEPELLKNAKTLAQLGAVTMKYVVMNPDLLNWYKNNFNVEDLKAEINADTIADLTDIKCTNLAAEIGAKLGAYALDQSKKNTHFSLENAKPEWTYADYCDEIVDWALLFAKGLPAVAVKHIDAKLGEYNGYGPFYKLNVVLNELLDFSFLSNVGDATFKLDTKTLIFDTIVKNAFNFDVAAILKVFEVNHNEGNVLNGPVIKGVISIVDRLLTSLFNHTCGISKPFTKELDCTHEISGSYDSYNGHYVNPITTKDIDTHKFAELEAKHIKPTCKDKGTKFFECSKCGEVKTEEEAATGVHEYEPTGETTTLEGVLYNVCKCKGCGDEKLFPSEAGDTGAAPANLCDVNGDKKYGSDDARLALRASVGLEEDIKPGTDAFLAADVNGDKKVGSDDARFILRLSVGLEKIEELKAAYGK